MTLFTKGNIYIMLFIAIGLAYVIFLVYQNVYANQKEHFEEPVNDKTYKANLQVIKVFDVVLNRKPTNEELEKYGKMENEQDILLAVMNDYRNAPNTTTKTPEKTEEKTVEKLEEKKPVETPEKEPAGIAGAFKEAYDNVVNDERVCMNKKDVVDMLTNISEQVSTFIKMVK